jgi:hexosaminidase
LTFILLSCDSSDRIEKPGALLPVIPQPNEVRVYEGFYTLDSLTGIEITSEEQKKVAMCFSNELKKSYGWSCPVGSSLEEKNKIVLTQNDELGDEAYLLDISSTNISINASSEAGYFYAFQTVLQLIPVSEEKNILSHVEIPQATIRDQPRFFWRGVLLDLARHFFGPASIKKIIDQMAAQKMNRLHIHLTDNEGWRIEIKEYPELHVIGSRGDRTNPEGPALYLTEDEARDITAYANERQIVMVPEIEMPGHSGAIGRAYPDFSGGNNTLNIANEDAIKMHEVVILRVADIFNTRYVHFGSDEVREHDWEGRADMRAKMDELGIADQKEFEGWFDRRMADFIVHSGLTPVAWDEASDFGINKNTIVQWWRCLQPETLDTAAERGYDIIISPADVTYLDYPYSLDEAGAPWEGLHNGGNSTELIYMWDPVPGTFDDAEKKHVLGIEAAVWTEFISNQKRLEYMIFPRLSAVAETAWTYYDNKDWEAFQERLTSQYKRYENAGINYRIPNMGIEERKRYQPEAFEGPLPADRQ